MPDQTPKERHDAAIEALIASKARLAKAETEIIQAKAAHSKAVTAHDQSLKALTDPPPISA